MRQKNGAVHTPRDLNGKTIAVPSLGDFILGYPHQVLGSRSLSTAYFCNGTFAAQNVAALRNFRRGLDEASAYVNAHPAEMIPLLAKYTNIDVKTVSSMTPNSLGSAADLLDPRLIAFA